MLIDDLQYFKRSSNYTNKYSGIDTPGFSSPDFNEYPIQDFDYQFNSWGFRGPEYDQYVGKAVNICLGDSFTVNVGGPVEHSWCSELAKHFDIPTLNLGMDGAGNDAIKLVYTRACKLFDVQDTFVMYSFLHRRLINGEFSQDVNKDNKNFEYFLKQRISNVIECALPLWCWSAEEKQFLSESGIYFLDIPVVLNFSDNQSIDRRFIIKESYNNLRGPDWPSLKEFVNGADPHPDMFTKQFGNFLSNHLYTNRDGHHMNYNANKKYANYLYQQWDLNNES
jgi:hypothetical protein